ncbi:MAG: hypothetical protein EXS11_01395 [Gemmataceae bacterium]|nr:hypothetical protein [Gemmataceae bacterium]
MKIDYVPLLAIQRDLHRLPPTRERFQNYLTLLYSPGQILNYPPLVLVNPMAKGHVTQLLDDLLSLDAEFVAQKALLEVANVFPELQREFKLALVLADDSLGGWTNRFDCEYNIRQGTVPMPIGGEIPRWVNHWWLGGILWSSEAISVQNIRETILASVYRAAYIHTHGTAQTLRDLLSQEGQVMASAGCVGPVLDPDDLEYTREVLVRYLEATDKRTMMECLFGDDAGRTLGFTPRGLSPWAGLAWALHDAMSKPVHEKGKVPQRSIGKDKLSKG